jgi:hypothetical protein
MVWFFAVVVLLLLVYNRGFRRVALYVGGLAVVFVCAVGALSSSNEVVRVIYALLAVGGLVWMLLRLTAPPAVGSLAWARSRIRKL